MYLNVKYIEQFKYIFIAMIIVMKYLTLPLYSQLNPPPTNGNGGANVPPIPCQECKMPNNASPPAWTNGSYTSIRTSPVGCTCIVHYKYRICNGKLQLRIYKIEVNPLCGIGDAYDTYQLMKNVMLELFGTTAIISQFGLDPNATNGIIEVFSSPCWFVPSGGTSGSNVTVILPCRKACCASRFTWRTVPCSEGDKVSFREAYSYRPCDQQSLENNYPEDWEDIGMPGPLPTTCVFTCDKWYDPPYPY